jgi:hypothetical protein
MKKHIHSKTRKRQHKRANAKTTLKYGGGKRAKAFRKAFGKIVPSGVKGLFRKGRYELSPLTPANQEGYLVAEEVVIPQKKTPSPIPADNSEEEREMKKTRANEAKAKKEPTPIPTESEEERVNELAKVINKQPSPLETAPYSGEYVSLNTIKQRSKKQKAAPPLPERLYNQPANSHPNLNDVLPASQPTPTTITQTTPPEELESTPRRGSLKKTHKPVAARPKPTKPEN